MPADVRALALAGIFLAFAQAQPPAARGFIGVALTDLPNGRGVRVAQLQPGGPADRAGLKIGDMVVEINGSPIDRSSTMIRVVSALSPGTTARLRVIHPNGASAMVSVAITAAQSAAGSAPSAGAEAVPPAPAATSLPPSTARLATSRLAISGYTRFSDPLEQAFTIQVPSGWRTEGGLLRLGALQINPYLRTLSPDRMTYLMFGEPTLPGFAPATAVGMKLGFREGTLYSPGFGQRVLIWHYLRGPEFARVYGEMALGNLCGGTKFLSGKELPQLASTMDSLVPTVIPSSSSGGEAVFTCTHNHQEMTARVEAVTRVTRDNVGWSVILLDAFIAPSGQAADAQTALTHVLKSIEWSQAWVQKQNALSQQAAQAISARVAQQERQQAVFLQKLNSVDENFEAMDELINGSSHYRDPQTGQDYYLNNTNAYKWIDDYGRVVSTSSNIKPPLGYNYRSLPRTSQ